MVYFCADDYGISKTSNDRIEYCLEHGALNKVSVLPNGEITDFKSRLTGNNAKLSLHINLVEGYPLSPPSEIGLLVSDDGCFRYSFIGLFFLSLSGKRAELEKQLYTEIRNQIAFWKKEIGEGVPLLLDSHQHTHMIPLVFKTLMKVIRDEDIEVEALRIPAEPISPYLLTPSLYAKYSITGLVKQWLLKFLGFINARELKKSKINHAYFMGALFSGKITEDKIKKLLPRYLKMASKRGRDIEIALHPGYLGADEQLIVGKRTGFEKFYFSPWRNKEYETLLNFKFE